MKNLIILVGAWICIIMFFLLSSCSLTKKVNKNKLENKVEVVSKIDTKITEVTTKTADSVIHTPVSIIEGQKPLDNIIKGDSLITENGAVKSTVKYDKKTGNIRVKTEQKPQVIPIKIKDQNIKVTEVSNNTAVKIEQKTTEKAIDKKVNKWPWWLIFFIIPIPLYYYRKYIPILKKIP